MTSRPFMPLFVGDYLADTGHLSRSEHGGYMLLLMHYWTRGGPIPDDDKILREITKSTRYAWSKLRENLQNFFTVEAGFWRHKRVDLELAKLKHKIDLRARTEAPRSASPASPSCERGSTHIHKDREDSSPKANAPAEGVRAPSARRAPTPLGARPPCSIFSEAEPLLGKRHVGLVGFMLKRVGIDRVRFALEAVRRTGPDSPAGFFRAVCEGREARAQAQPTAPTPVEPLWKRSALVARLLHEQGRQKALAERGLWPPEEKAAA